MPYSQRLALLLLPLAILLLAQPAPAEEAVGPEEALIQAKAPAIVSMKFVLQITMEMGGRVREIERNGRALGVVVDASGLIMVRSSAFEARMGARGRGGRNRRGGDAGPGPNISATPTNIRVTLPGQEKEHLAIMGAKDSKSGLAFVLIKEVPADLKLTAADFSRAATPKIGQDLFGVSRLGQGFDHAAFCDRIRVTGKVSKPKAMWILPAKAANFVGLPLHTKGGAVAGVCAIQQGVGEGSGSSTFLMPVESVRKTIASATKEAKRIRAELAEDEEDAADEAKDEETQEDGGDK